MRDQEEKNIDKFVEKIAKKFGKLFHCAVTNIKKEEVLQLQGNHYQGIKDYFIDIGLAKEDQIKIHGT